MIIGIDASNIRSEGGIIHLTELVNSISLDTSKINKIIIWGDFKNLNKIKNDKKIHKSYINNYSQNLLFRIFWQFFLLPRILKKKRCSILFVLGGIFFNKKIKTVTIFQNILPFISNDIKKYSVFKRYKMFLQKILYLKSFKNSDGIIFLSKFSKKILSKELNLTNIKHEIIPHGISNKFTFRKRKIDKKKIINLLYVSTIDIYKHQDIIISVIGNLKKNLKLKLNLVGPYSKKYKELLDKLIFKLELKKNVRFYGRIKNIHLNKIYNKNDIKIHFSKAETFGMTMLEAMKCGLPVISIKSEISKEILGEAGIFCKNSENSVEKAIYKVLNNKKYLDRKIFHGREISRLHNWKTTSRKTILFLEQINSL